MLSSAFVTISKSVHLPTLCITCLMPACAACPPWVGFGYALHGLYARIQEKDAAPHWGLLLSVAEEEEEMADRAWF